MEDKHEAPQGCAAIFHVKVRKNMDIEIWGDAITCALYNLINAAIAKAINENITDEDKLKMIELLSKENNLTMVGESSKIILNTAVSDTETKKAKKRTPRKESKIILKKPKTDPFKGGYRSPYLPPKKK